MSKIVYFVTFFQIYIFAIMVIKKIDCTNNFR